MNFSINLVVITIIHEAVHHSEGNVVGVLNVVDTVSRYVNRSGTVRYQVLRIEWLRIHQGHPEVDEVSDHYTHYKLGREGNSPPLTGQEP